MSKRLLTLFVLLTGTAVAQVPEWNAANLSKTCDRACLVSIMDLYMNAMFMHNPKAVPPLAKDYRMTENTGVIEVGEQSSAGRPQHARSAIAESGYAAG